MGGESNTNLINYSFVGKENFYNSTFESVPVKLKNENDLEVKREVQNCCFAVGDIITFIVSIKNIGVGYFAGLRVEDNFGGQNFLEYVAGSGAVYKNGCLAKPEVVSVLPLTFSLLPLVANESIILTYSCKVTNNIPKSISRFCSAVEVTGYTTNCTITKTAEVQLERTKTAELQITKSVSAGEVVSGEIFSYYLTIENSGLLDAEVVKISDSVASGFKILSVKIKEGEKPERLLRVDEYLLDSANNFCYPANSSVQNKIFVPKSNDLGAGKTVVTLTGYFGK